MRRSSFSGGVVLEDFSYRYREFLNILFTQVHGKVKNLEIAKLYGVAPSTLTSIIGYLRRIGFTFSADVVYRYLGLRKAYILTTRRIDYTLIKGIAPSLYPPNHILYVLYLPLHTRSRRVARLFKSLFKTKSVALVDYSLGCKPDLVSFNVPSSEEDIGVLVEKLDEPNYRLSTSFIERSIRVRFNSLDLFVLKELELDYFTTCKEIAVKAGVPYHRVLKSLEKLKRTIIGVRCRRTPWTSTYNLRAVALLDPVNSSSSLKLFSTLPRFPLMGSVNLSSGDGRVTVVSVIDSTLNPIVFRVFERLVEYGFVKKYSVFCIFDYRGLRAYTLPYKIGVEYDKYLRRFIV